MRSALRLAVLEEFCERSGRSKCSGDLLVQFLPVSDDDEGPTAPQPPQHLLGEHHHREALAAALRVPEDAETPLITAELPHGFVGTIDTENLMVLCDELAQ